uniref:Uncharacterized protein n=1 Tax=Panagrolaimus sp. JU765 TaxID=591449 RepID=A0AC34R8Z7_9BILA
MVEETPGSPEVVENRLSDVFDIKSKFPVRETRSSLPLQMALHFHSFLDPIIYISLIGCLIIKYDKVHPTYRVILFAMLLISISIEVI